MLLKRVSQSSYATYNRVLERYIQQISQDGNVTQNIESIPFYISCLIGEAAIKQAYIPVLRKIKDSAHQNKLLAENKKYFSRELVEKILATLMTTDIYWNFEHQKSNFLQSEVDKQGLIQFAEETSPEDKQAIENIQWLLREKNFKDALRYQNELACKLLVSGKIKALRFLMEQSM